MLYDPKWEIPTPAVTNEPWRDALLRAADLIREHGLAKFTQRDERGAMCIQGALSIAVTGKIHAKSGTPIYCDASQAVIRYLKSIGTPKEYIGTLGSAHWNNADERTAEEVIGALESAARC